MNKTVVITAIAFILIATFGTWYFLRPTKTPTVSVQGTVAPIEGAEAAPGFADATGSTSSLQAGTASSGPLAPPRQAPAGHKEYRNEQYRFSLFYPESLAVHEYDEGGGARTITFENAVAVQGFQIFVVPYGGAQVTTAQFKKDAPTGVMKEPQNIELDGALATIFFSESPLLGETREVWVIHGGHLFEVTTTKQLDEWLGAIMLSWKFI